MLYPYSDSQVKYFTLDVMEAYVTAGAPFDVGASIWLGRMQYDAVTMDYPAARDKQLTALWEAIGRPRPGPAPIPAPVPQPIPDLTPFDQFMIWVSGKPFGQQTLLDLEPTLIAAGWMLTPPNKAGDRTKVHPPGGPWTRVGFGENRWVWVPQAEQ